MSAAGLALLTFRLDRERRQRLRAKLAADGRTLSEVVIRGLHDYVQHSAHRAGVGVGVGVGTDSPKPRAARLADLALPDQLGARLRELRASGRTELLSAALAALHADGWPLTPLARALGISKQAVQARIRRTTVGGSGSASSTGPAGATGAAGSAGAAGPTNSAAGGWRPPSFPRHRPPSVSGSRPHLTVRIDRALRAAAHLAAAAEGSSLSLVVEKILDRYLHQRPSGGAGDPPRPMRR
jgi:predicted HicB family RNase H-like nuclease